MERTIIVIARVLLATAVLLTAACDDGTKPPVPDQVVVSPSMVTFTAVGETQQLTARVFTKNGKEIEGTPVSWSSSAPGVAAVFATGLATAVSAGTATITATSEGKSGSATVTVPSRALTVTKAGTGGGTVASSPVGINCGTTCSASYSSGTVVTLTATAAAGSTFEGWSGACTGTSNTCQVTMSEVKTVTATFRSIFTLTVARAGTGSGTVTSNPAGIDCGSTCSSVFLSGATVTLTATAASGSTFTGWSGACIGIGSMCQVTLSEARSVTAAFDASGLGGGFGPEQFALIPAGTFQMGDMVGSGRPYELPVHTVNITRAFYMQKTEVTQGQWRAVMGTNPSSFSDCGDLCPVEQVSWNDIQTFLAALNTMDPGKNYRLPTEAEWEYAARAGTTGDYGGTGVLDQMGWYPGNSGERIHPVAQKTANAWGLFDMHGNVWEWVNDWYSATYYQYKVDNEIVNDPPGPETGSDRVTRGGSCRAQAFFATSASRWGSSPSEQNRYRGFRLARTQ